MAASNKKFNLTELLNQRSKEAAPQGAAGRSGSGKGHCGNHGKYNG